MIYSKCHFDPEEHAMARIVIKDLTESVDLDRAAMIAIMGGARTPGRQAFPGNTISRGTRIVNIVNYPAGFTRKPPAAKTAPSK